MYRIQRSKKYLLISAAILVTLGLAGSYLLFRTRAQSDVTIYLTDLLVKQGVPLKSVSIKNFLNLNHENIEIMIETTGDNKADDLWNIHLARRAATLAYQHGYPIKSYSIVVVDDLGMPVNQGIDFLSPSDLSQQPFPIPVKVPDNKKTKLLIREGLDTNGMILDSVEVTNSVGSLDAVQTVQLKLLAPDLDFANQALPNFINSLQPFIEQINTEPGVRIAVFHLLVASEKGDVFLNYIIDLEIHRRSWRIADGVTKSWFPHPVEETKITPEPEQLNAYPPPATPTPTLVPTPYP
jgi:hypothetical protein